MRWISSRKHTNQPGVSDGTREIIMKKDDEGILFVVGMAVGGIIIVVASFGLLYLAVKVVKMAWTGE